MRWLALPSLLLTLLVPAQAIDLCCLGVAGPAAPVSLQVDGEAPHPLRL